MFSFEQLANMTSSLTCHPQIHTLAELDQERLPANPPGPDGLGADGLGAIMLNPSPSLAGFQTAPQAAIHPVQAVSTYLSTLSLLLKTISGKLDLYCPTHNILIRDRHGEAQPVSSSNTHTSGNQGLEIVSSCSRENPNMDKRAHVGNLEF